MTHFPKATTLRSRGGGRAAHTHLRTPRPHAALATSIRMMRLGRGVNIAPFVVRYEQVDAAADLAGLKARGVEHVRIGGWIAAALQNWTTCPATTVPMPAHEQDAVSWIVDGEAAAPDPAARRAFWRLWQATKAAVDAGLLVVLNPFHQRMLVPVSAETVRWVWTAVLSEFSAKTFPVDRVAFEMVNEPANWTHASVVGDNWTAIVREWVIQVRRVQPDRVLILTGVQGRRGGHPPSVSSREGLVADLHRGGLVPPECDHKCIVTFHYYEPRWFTTQAPSAGSPGWVDNASALAAMAEHFKSVANATPSGVGIYLGEYGLVPDRVNVTQGARWLAAVRQAAVQAGFAGYSVWTYYGTQNGLVPEMAGFSSARERLCAWDRSPLAAAAVGLPFDDRRAPAQNATERTSCNQTADGDSDERLWYGAYQHPAASSTSRTCPADGERRPPWADALVASQTHKRLSLILSAARLVDVFGFLFLFGVVLFWTHRRFCSAWRGGMNINRLVAVRQMVEFSAGVPPPTASPPQPPVSPLDAVQMARTHSWTAMQEEERRLAVLQDAVPLAVKEAEGQHGSHLPEEASSPPARGTPTSASQTMRVVV
jgi:hypothetical protein